MANDSNKFSYWKEAVMCSFEEHGISAMDEQISGIAEDMDGACENIGMAFHVPENPLLKELDNAKKELQIEREKEHCFACRGTGRVQSYGGTLVFDSQCDKCNGEGKYIL